MRQIENRESSDYRPSDHMRDRRPEYFSDSKQATEVVLSQDLLEYHLDTLTKRKQETEFEHFARRLAEKEICPNLLPQTGPTGGGDSKVDSETYPVADAITSRWYEGIGREAGEERWAFAISAKKDWKGKIKSDVFKIQKTERGYKRVYFVTNQFVPDKDRAATEDKLSNEYGLSVHILDRSWIIKCILEHDRAHLAIETLQMHSLASSERKIVGSRDIQRTAELEELEKQIQDPERYSGVEYQLAEDCLRAALLARGLERPRIEVEGRFERAQRIAAKVGYIQQQLRTVYARAWTAFWWYDDFEELNRLYDEVEALAFGSDQAQDLELVSNLWSCINVSVERGSLDALTAKHAARTSSIKAELQRLESDKNRPNNALKARTNRLIIALHESRLEREPLEAVLAELKTVIVESRGLIDYPFESISQIIRELGMNVTDSKVYDELLEELVEATTERSSEGSAGRILLERGFQMASGEKMYEAIKILGRAQGKLARQEDRGACISALGGCGIAYKQVGLLWAARACSLAAANLIIQEFYEHGEMHRMLLLHIQKIVSIELQLGRVNHVLAWMGMAPAVVGILSLKGEELDEYKSWQLFHDQLLGALLLRTDIDELKWLGSLPVILEMLELDHSWMAILYALGHEEELRAQGALPEEIAESDILNLFNDWTHDDAMKGLPRNPNLMMASHVELQSVILGCRIKIRVANNDNSIALGEMILSALESYLATSVDICTPHISQYDIDIKPSDFHSGPPKHTFGSGNRMNSAEIIHSESIGAWSIDIRAVHRNWLVSFIVELSARIMFISDLDIFTKRVLKEEDALGRATIFSETMIAMGNVLGARPRIKLSDWNLPAGAPRFVLKRDKHWSQSLQQASRSEVRLFANTNPGIGNPPSELLKVDGKHTDRIVFSVIDVPLWDQAKWYGVGFGVDRSGWLHLYVIFTDREAAKSIFKEFRAKFGKVDHNEMLRVSLIKGVDKLNPHHYRVVIGSHPTVPEGAQEALTMVSVARVNTMTPENSINLERFIKDFDRKGRYRIAPALFDSRRGYPEILEDLWIEKQEVRIVSAWEIGENDPDSVAIYDDEEPIVPDGVKDPPILRLLEGRKASKNKIRHS